MQKNTPNYTPNTHFGVLGCPGGGLGGSKSSEGLRRGFFAPNQKVVNAKPLCIYPTNIARVVRFQNFEISTLSPPLVKSNKCNQCNFVCNALCVFVNGEL